MRRILYNLSIAIILSVCGYAMFNAIKLHMQVPVFPQESPLEALQHLAPFKNGVSSLTIFFRPLDTLGGIMVLFGGVIAMRTLIAQDDKRSDWGPVYESALLSLITGVFFSLCLTFAFYLLVYGNQHPGGGIKSGIMMAAGSILFLLAYGHKIFARKFHPEYFIGLSVVGLLFFVSVFWCITVFPRLINMISGFFLGLGLMISVGVILTGLFWELAKEEKGEN